jgi:ketosteroid isomerase-like protein
MSRENVEIARAAVAAGFVAQPPDEHVLRAVLDPACVLTSDWGAERAEHRGVEGALAAITEMSTVWESWEQQVERVIDAGDDVVALLRLRATGRGSAAPVEFAWAMVATLSNGRIVRGRTFLSQPEALKAVGLEE